MPSRSLTQKLHIKGGEDESLQARAQGDCTERKPPPPQGRGLESQMAIPQSLPLPSLPLHIPGGRRLGIRILAINTAGWCLLRARCCFTKSPCSLLLTASFAAAEPQGAQATCLRSRQAGQWRGSKPRPSSGPSPNAFLGSPPPGREKGLGRALRPPEGTRLHRE